MGLLVAQWDVEQFHRKAGQLVNKSPQVPSQDVKALRLCLHREEYSELSEAIMSNDMVEIADGIADLIYVLLGTAVSYGIDMDPIFHDVHVTNMLKLGGADGPQFDSNGKIVKPKGWRPPRVEQLLIEQGWRKPCDDTCGHGE